MAKLDGRYELFGWDYESVNPLTEAEVAWHVAWARRTGGPVLGLACGTGRLACRLAQAGFQTVGLDLSPTMLALAGKHREALAEPARGRLELIRGDMADFELGRTFGLILIADNSFRELPTRAGLLDCLRCTRRHLAAGGRALITDPRFDPARYSGGRRVWDWSAPLAHPDTGEQVTRRVEVELSADRARVRGVMTYKTVAADGTETITECPFDSPILAAADYQALFAEAGQAAEAFADYTDRRADGGETMTCFVCRARP